MTTAVEKKRVEIRTKYRNKVKGGTWSYNQRHDAYYETKTRRWVEGVCKDKACQFCVKRPPLAPKRRVRHNKGVQK